MNYKSKYKTRFIRANMLAGGLLFMVFVGLYRKERANALEQELFILTGDYQIGVNILDMDSCVYVSRSRIMNESCKCE